jgi:hypothetical protein
MTTLTPAQAKARRQLLRQRAAQRSRVRGGAHTTCPLCGYRYPRGIKACPRQQHPSHTASTRNQTTRRY